MLWIVPGVVPKNVASGVDFARGRARCHRERRSVKKMGEWVGLCLFMLFGSWMQLMVRVRGYDPVRKYSDALGTRAQNALGSFSIG